MANGEEDLKEKNKGRKANKSDYRYSKWSSKWGEEDSGMLMEKSTSWSALRESKGEYDEGDE